jgi:hypothetical protein
MKLFNAAWAPFQQRHSSSLSSPVHQPVHRPVHRSPGAGGSFSEFGSLDRGGPVRHSLGDGGSPPAFRNLLFDLLSAIFHPPPAPIHVSGSSISKSIVFILCLATAATAQTAQTNVAVRVRHVPNLNGNGRIVGSVQQLNGESLNLNGGLVVTGDLLVPGTPALTLNGHPTFAGTIVGTGSASPSGYNVIINGNVSLRYLRTHTTPSVLPNVAPPPSPTGTRNVTLNQAGQSPGDFTTLRNLTLQGNAGLVAVPPNTYGNFVVNGGTGLVLGVAGGGQPAIYNLQNLTLNGNSTLKVVGPVVLTVANGFTANGNAGSSNNPAWFQLQVASGGFTLNGGCTVYGLVLAPNGVVIVNGNSSLFGTSTSDQFTLNGGSMVQWAGAAAPTNLPPVATPQSITLAENTSTNITLTGSDSQGRTLTFTLLTLPTHGTASGTPPSVTYKPATNYFGSDAFTFKVNNGLTDSLPATISLTVTQVYYPPTAFAQSLTNLEDTALPVTLTGYDPEGYALTFSVLTQPAHGTLSGMAPHLTYHPATNYFGNDSFTFQVSDGVSNSLAAMIGITNQPVDDPPVVVAGPNQLIILPTNSVDLAGSVTYDVFPGTVDTILWSKVSGPGNVTFSNPSNTLTMGTFSQSGIYRVRLYASDSFLSGSNDLFITVDAPPVVGAGQTMTNTFPGIITLAGSANDDGLPTNGVLTVAWSKVSGPGTVVFGNAATTNSTATFSANGVYVLRLSADDSIATNHSDVTVIENLPPAVNAGNNILTNGLRAILNGSVTDDGLPGGFLSMQWSQAGGSGTVTFGNASATNTTVIASQSGTYVLVLTAYDGAATNSGEVVVTFNLPPVVNVGPVQTVNFGTTVTLAGTVTDDQLPYNILTSTWTEVNGPGNATFANANLTNTTVTFDQPGTYTLRLTASDTLATTDADVVIRVNAAPVVNAGTNRVVTLGTLVTLAGSYTDDGIPGSTVTTLWTQISGPAGAVFVNPTAVSTTVNFSQSGEYVFQLTANDGLTNGSAQVSITVDQAPVVTAVSPVLINWPANQVVLSGTVSDDGLPNGGTLTSVWSQISGPSPANLSSPSLANALNGATIIIQPSTTATFSVPGLYVLRLTADDGQIANYADVTVTVNQAPAVDAGTNQIVTGTNQLPLSGTVIDDGFPLGRLTSTWSLVNGPGTVDFQPVTQTNNLTGTEVTNVVSATATFSQPGVYVLRLTADDTLATNSDDVTISITETESGDFLVEAGPDQIISLPNPASLAGTVEIQVPVTGGQTNVTWSKLNGPGNVQFSDPNVLTTIAQFSQPGTYTLKLRVTYADGTRSDALVVDVLPPPPDRLRAARSNRGTDFWLTFFENYAWGEVPYDGRELIIAAEVDTAGTVTVSNDWEYLEKYFRLQAGSTTTIPINLCDCDISVSDSIRASAIHITADHPVTVHGLNYRYACTDGYLALPTAMLGTDYIVLAYRNSPSWYDTNDIVGGTQFAVVASENDTSITITPSVTSDSRAAGVPYQIILQQGETYRLINSDGPDADLTGTIISADKPIAVFGGNTIALVPPSIPAGDHLVEQLPPVNTWGRHFVTMPLAGRLNGDTFRFLAATNGTRVAINGKIVVSLNRGQFYEQIIDGPAEILASKPILVAQFANGSDYDGCLGDPFMMLIPPFEQFGGDYILSTAQIFNYPKEVYTNYLNLIVRSNGVGTILLDDVPMSAGCFQLVGNSGYAGAQIPVNPGVHHLSAPVPFGACVYGWADYESYAFMGGFYSETIESDTRLELTQPTPFAAVGSEKAVIARVTNGRGLPIPGIELSFTVCGANVAAGQATTSRFGDAVFSYTGTNAGVDVITAMLVDLARSVTNTWIAGSDNAPPVVSTAGTQPLQFSRMVELVGLVADDNRPAGGNLHVQWQLLDGSADVQFENATQSVARAVCPESGWYQFELSADDTQFSSHALVEVIVDDLPGVTGYEIPSVAPVGSPIGLSADAWDDDGSIDRVEFYANDSLIGAATNGDLWTSYNVDWIPSTNGCFQIRAVAFDNLGGSNSSDMGVVQVDFPPQVLIDSPVSGTVLTGPTNVFVHATASDPDGAVVSISVYANGDLLGTSGGPEIATNWFPRRQGDYTLTVVATDDLGLTTTSEGVPVTVTGDFPQVTILNSIHEPGNCGYMRIPMGVPLYLQANVWMPGPFHITNVTFYINGEPIGSVSEPPYQILWTPGVSLTTLSVVAEADSGAIGDDWSLIETFRKISIAFAAPRTDKPVAVGMPTAIQLSVDDPACIIETFDYYVNGQLLVETTNSDPVFWRPPAPGNYELRACAVDRVAGINFPTCAETLSVTANFAFINDGVLIVSPNDGDSLYVGSPVPICLAFEDPTGDFDHAEIFTNGVSLGQTTNSCFDWVPQQTNNYSLTAVAYDHQGHPSSPSPPVLVHVLIPPPAPAISINTLPEGETNAVVGFPLLVVASFSTTNVPISKVELFADGQAAGELTNTPWLFPYIATNPGPHVLSARVTTLYQTTADSQPLYVNATPQLEVMWEGIRSGEWVPVGTNKTLGIRLADPGSIFDHVEFWVNGAVLTNTRFYFTDWTPAVPGDYTFRARAYDRFGNFYETNDITLHSAVLHLPQVSFLTPVPLARFSLGQPVHFAVQAADAESTVTNLALFLYSQPEVSAAAAVLDYSWTNLPAGEHAFTAVATDDKGLTGEATVRVIIDAPVSADLLPPQNLAAQVLGCNAIRITWDTNSGAPTNTVVFERVEGTNEVWQNAGRVSLAEGMMENHSLNAATVYRYRAYVQNADGYRSVDSDVIVTRTRAYIPGFAVLDLGENLEDAGAFNASAAAGNEMEFRIVLVSFTLSPDDGAAVIDLSGFQVLGLSDFNYVLLNNASLANYLFCPMGNFNVKITDTNFVPYRLTRSGITVGARWNRVPVAPDGFVTQYHAGYWQYDNFVDLTPDVRALRIPADCPPLVMPYDTFDSVADMNASDAAVGVASWVWLSCLDGVNSTLMFGPAKNATVWLPDNPVPVNFGALQQLNNESEFLAINDAGDIVGLSALFDPSQPDKRMTHAVRSQLSLADALTNKLTDLGTLGGLYSAALDIGKSGVAIGYSTLLPEDAITNSRAVYWLPAETEPRRLPGYGDALLTYAWAINTANRIVGDAVDANGMQQAVLWEPNPSATNGLGYDLVNLNDLSHASDWQLSSARAINRFGFIAGAGYHLTWIYLGNEPPRRTWIHRPFLLLPSVSLAVDYNRDGKIELNQNDDLPDQQPYQFWINDDSDDGDTSSDLNGMSNVPGAKTGLFEFDGRDPNYADHKVNGACDLPDWFPVYLNISNLLAVLPPSQYKYRLVQAEDALNFLYTSLRPAEAGSYLTNVLTTGFGPNFDQPSSTAANVQQVTADGVGLSPEFLNKITSEGCGVLLFEARQATTQPLRLEVWNSKRLVTAVELPLRITGVENMYGWMNLRGAAGGTRDRLSNIGPSNWPVFATNGSAFVFLHGYNVNEKQSRGWAAEMFKRLWWSGSNRRFYAISWFGDDTQVHDIVTINYHTNVFHAFQTAPALADFLNVALKGRDVTVMAHSLGNMVTCFAIQDYGARPARYFMVDCAVAMETFDGGLDIQPLMTHPDWEGYPECLYASEWYKLFPETDGRHGLTWRDRFRDVPQRTALYNFYSSGEEVLENRHDGSDPWVTDVLSLQLQWPLGQLPVNYLPGRYAWVLQETLKGRTTEGDMTVLYAAGASIGGLSLEIAMQSLGIRAGNLVGSKYGGWGFNPHWDTSGSFEPVSLGASVIYFYIPGGHLAPAEAATITTEDLQTNPFFLPFLEPSLMTPDGSAVAANPAMRAQLLAEAIPSRTFGVGANRLVNRQNQDIGAANFNMNSEFHQRGWPAERTEDSLKQSRWLHSDLRDVAYPYNGMVFDKFVELEGEK